MDNICSSMFNNIGFVPSVSPGAMADYGTAETCEMRIKHDDAERMCAVILLGNPGYDEEHVVTRLICIVGLDFATATACFRKAQRKGSAVICVICQERAETYALIFHHEGIEVEIVIVG